MSNSRRLARYKYMKSPIRVISTLALLLGCKDIADPVDQVTVISAMSAFAPGTEPVVVDITNRSSATLLVRDHSELTRANIGTAGSISVGGCGLQPQLPSGWTLLPAGETVTCRHPTASTYAPGDYQLLVVVQEGDTVWRGGVVSSNVFRLEN
jgi:hypothetical protein